MTDEELLAQANQFILDHESDESALASVALWNLLRDVRGAERERAAKVCDGLAEKCTRESDRNGDCIPIRDEYANRSDMASICAAAIRRGDT